ncbi:hypothetical protein BSBH6_03575 [Bacillus subtilis]|nr:hypothetical protein BSBH6_03575 [Bacillus subtilis]RPK22314.1 hypothetical protein BH5_03579 [Bacillus subtilis]
MISSFPIHLLCTTSHHPLAVTSFKKHKKPPSYAKDEGLAVPPLLTALQPFTLSTENIRFDTPLLVTGRESRHRLLSVQQSNSEAHSASGEDRFTPATDSLNLHSDAYLLFLTIVDPFYYL